MGRPKTGKAVSIRGTTYAKLKAEAERCGVSTTQLAENIITKALNAEASTTSTYRADNASGPNNDE